MNIRQWCSAVYCYAVTTLRADADPTLVLKDAIERPATKHKTPLTKEQIPVFMHRVDHSELFPMTRIALKLLLYMFKRPVEVRNAEWQELDLDAAEWQIPAKRMKKRKAHVEPLSTQTVALLRELKAMTGSQDLLFPNHRRSGTAMAETTLSRALVSIGYENEFTPHGFRATASTLLHQLGFDASLIELSLAHKRSNTTAASYNQYQYIAERRKLMQSWSDYIDALCAGANVTPIRKAKAA
jgi:integrase